MRHMAVLPPMQRADTSVVTSWTVSEIFYMSHDTVLLGTLTLDLENVHLKQASQYTRTIRTAAV